MGQFHRAAKTVNIENHFNPHFFVANLKLLLPLFFLVDKPTTIQKESPM